MYIDAQTIYSGAPGMLMDRIHEVNALLGKSELKSGRTESWLFWKKTSDVMKYAWDYMRSLEWILRKNEQLEIENRYLRARNMHLEELLTEFNLIRRLRLTNKLEETVKHVDAIIAMNLENIERALKNE